MCSICAVYGPKAEQHIKRICASLAPQQGASNEGFFIDGNIALGYKAPKIGGTQIPHQPLANEDKTIWITFEGEIYNKGQLMRQLQKNHKFQTDLSAEVAVHAYEHYDFHCLNRFNGMFSFCLWDSKKECIFSARDRFGITPLYYYCYQDHLVFASEIKGILSDPSVSKEPNERFIYEYLVTGYPNRAGETFFMGINEMMPAHYMVVDKGGINPYKYWQPARHFESNLSVKEDDWFASEFRKLLRDSINIRLPENSPIGTFLSGGLDSSLIVFLVDDILKSKHQDGAKSSKLQEIFSAIYKEPTEQGDEKLHIEQVEHALRTKVNYVFPSVAGEWDSIKQFVVSIEEPVAVFNYYVFWCLFQAAKKKTRIVFSGQGSDAIFGGQTKHVLTYFNELWKAKRIGTLLNELAKSLDWMLPWLVWAILFERKAEQQAKMLLAPQFVAAHDQGERKKKDYSLQSALYDDVTLHAVEYLRVDHRASSAFSMECRHPFLDHRIVEFAFSLPSTQKIRDGWTKYIVRNAMKGLVPEAIRKKRKKFGTPIPQQRWMRELRRDIREIFESNKFRERGYYNQRAILEIFDRYCEGKLSRLERQQYADMIWRIINVELWLEAFVD